MADGVSAAAWAATGDRPLASAPRWFRDALAEPVERASVQSAGAAIAIHRWGHGEVSHVLVHGGGANAGWWAHLAPLLARDAGAVVAIDLSGHGDSDWREAYDLETWGEEVRDVVRATAAPGSVVVVGHSLGGVVALTAAARSAHGFAGCILVDALLRQRSARQQANRARIVGSPTPVFATRAAARARFRPFPKPPRVLSYVADAVADWSLRTVDGGFTWKFDPRVFSRPDIDALPVPLVATAFVRPQHGLVDDQMLAATRSRIALAGVVELPGAGHHAMLDEPLSLVDAIQSADALVRGRSSCPPAAQTPRRCTERNLR